MTAQLQHPGIVPVHELGRLSDGRWYFTMKEVVGRTLGSVVREVHEASELGWAPGASGWTFRRLVDAVFRVSQAVRYAHSRGVVQRDLKPDNVMVGDYGEVQVIDWGLAKLRDASEAPVSVTGDASGSSETVVGTVTGTPAYMPPEQASGEVHRVDARSDVYALGAMLYKVLTGRPPYPGGGWAVVGAVLKGPPPPTTPCSRCTPPRPPGEALWAPAPAAAPVGYAWARDASDACPGCAPQPNGTISTSVSASPPAPATPSNACAATPAASGDPSSCRRTRRATRARVGTAAGPSMTDGCPGRCS